MGDDVWIGQGATILFGVTIGKGAVIGARSVVAQNLPPYAVVVGNPGKIIKYRFDEEICAVLNELDYQEISPAIIREMPDLFLSSMDSNLVTKISDTLQSWEK